MTTETKDKKSETTQQTANRSRAFRNGRIDLTPNSENGFEMGGTVHIPRLLAETKIGFERNHDKQKETSPDYWLFTPFRNREGGIEWTEAGSAWIKTPKDGGDKFLSLSVDLADEPAAINMAAFAADKEFQPKNWNEGEAPVTWSPVYSRPRRGKSTPAKSAAQSYDIDDSIKF